jgi:hypothetical protein
VADSKTLEAVAAGFCHSTEEVTAGFSRIEKSGKLDE